MRSVVWAALALSVSASTPASAKKPTGKGPCKNGDDCAQGTCVEVNGDSYCSTACGSCPGGMYCDAKLFGSFNLSVCLRGTESAPVQPKRPPRIPCKIDDECQGGLVCGQMMGQRDCTLVCESNRQCEAPEMMGVKMDFLECKADEGRPSRQVCLPKTACMKDPTRCITMGPNVGPNVFAPPPGFGPPPTYAPPPPQTPPPPPSLGPPMAEARFAALLEQVKDAAFADDRTSVIKMAAPKNAFSCAQVLRLLGALSFEEEKVSFVEILAPRIVDRDNQHQILEGFTFSGSKDQAAEILGKY